MTARDIRFGLILAMCASYVGPGLLTQTANAQDLAARGDQLRVQQKYAARKPGSTANALASVETAGSDVTPEARSVKKPSTAKGPYYVDFRARTAATYGHAFVWYGKTSQKAVDVAGLHPAGDVLPYVLGHLMWVPSETGASYGDLDVQYLTASYRVYLNEADAKRVFAFINHLEAVERRSAPSCS